jgi:hypothetical protein
MHCRVLPERLKTGRSVACNVRCSSPGLLNLHGWVLWEIGVECSMHGECSRRNLPTIARECTRVLLERRKMHGRVLPWRLKLHGRVLSTWFHNHRKEECSQPDSECLEECSRRNWTTIARMSVVSVLKMQGRVLPACQGAPGNGRNRCFMPSYGHECSQWTQSAPVVIKLPCWVLQECL